MSDTFRIEFSLVSPNAYDAFSRAFRDVPHVALHREPIDKIKADCIATTANSYGRMDGGIDGTVNAMMTYYEPNQSYFHERVQSMIRSRYCGEQPVGTTLLMRTHHPTYRWVAHMPTMRVPEDVSESLNAYLAFRSLLVEILWYNKIITSPNTNNADIISSVVCVPCCTSSGSMSYERSARQMRAAWDSVFADPPKMEDWPLLHRAHRELRGA